MEEGRKIYRVMYTNADGVLSCVANILTEGEAQGRVKFLQERNGAGKYTIEQNADGALAS